MASSGMASPILTVALFVSGAYALREAWAQRQGAPGARRQARGTVRHVRVAPGPALTGSHAAPGHHVAVEYEYTVGGRRYVHAETVATLAERAAAEEVAEARWNRGTPVEVWYEPEAPERATVVPPAPVAAYLGVLGVFLLVAAAAAALGW